MSLKNRRDIGKIQLRGDLRIKSRVSQADEGTCCHKKKRQNNRKFKGRWGDSGALVTLQKCAAPYCLWPYSSGLSCDATVPALSPLASSPPLYGAAPFPRSASSAPSHAASSALALAAAAARRRKNNERRGSQTHVVETSARVFAPIPETSSRPRPLHKP